MEQIVSSEKRAVASSAHSQNLDQGNLLSAQADLLTEDPATFLVAHHILLTGVDSVDAIKSYFKRAPGILGIVDELLAQMDSEGLVSVDGDKLTVSQRFLDLGGDVQNLRRFLPRLFKIAADRVLTDAVTGAQKQKRDGIRYWAIPNDTKSSLEAQAYYLEFKAKMSVLADRIVKEDRMAESVRLVGAFNCSLSPEDFE